MADELGRFETDLQSELAREGRKVAFRKDADEKMSEVIKEFIEPYQQDATTSEEYQLLIATAIIAWNAALEQGAKREAFLKDMLKTIAPKGDRQTQDDFYEVTREMIERKEKYFASNRRRIADYRLTETPGMLQLSIASLPE
jgi:hypothetical protein